MLPKIHSTPKEAKQALSDFHAAVIQLIESAQITEAHIDVRVLGLGANGNTIRFGQSNVYGSIDAFFTQELKPEIQAAILTAEREKQTEVKKPNPFKVFTFGDFDRGFMVAPPANTLCNAHDPIAEHWIVFADGLVQDDCLRWEVDQPAQGYPFSKLMEVLRLNLKSEILDRLIFYRLDDPKPDDKFIPTFNPDHPRTPTRAEEPWTLVQLLKNMKIVDQPDPLRSIRLRPAQARAICMDILGRATLPPLPDEREQNIPFLVTEVEQQLRNTQSIQEFNDRTVKTVTASIRIRLPWSLRFRIWLKEKRNYWIDMVGLTYLSYAMFCLCDKLIQGYVRWGSNFLMCFLIGIVCVGHSAIEARWKGGAK